MARPPKNGSQMQVCILCNFARPAAQYRTNANYYKDKRYSYRMPMCKWCSDAKDNAVRTAATKYHYTKHQIETAREQLADAMKDKTRPGWEQRLAFAKGEAEKAIQLAKTLPDLKRIWDLELEAHERAKERKLAVEITGNTLLDHPRAAKSRYEQDPVTKAFVHYKTCNTCSVEKPTKEFHFQKKSKAPMDPDASPPAKLMQSRCKECTTAYNAKRYAERREKTQLERNSKKRTCLECRMCLPAMSFTGLNPNRKKPTAAKTCNACLAKRRSEIDQRARVREARRKAGLLKPKPRAEQPQESP